MPRRQASRDYIHVAVAENTFYDGSVRHHNEVDPEMLHANTYHPDVTLSPAPPCFCHAGGECQCKYSDGGPLIDRRAEAGVLPHEADDPVLPAMFPGGHRPYGRDAQPGRSSVGKTDVFKRGLLVGRELGPGAEAEQRSMAGYTHDMLGAEEARNMQMMQRVSPMNRVAGFEPAEWNTEQFRRHPDTGIAQEYMQTLQAPDVQRWGSADSEIQDQIRQIAGGEGADMGHHFIGAMGKPPGGQRVKNNEACRVY